MFHTCVSRSFRSLNTECRCMTTWKTVCKLLLPIWQSWWGNWWVHAWLPMQVCSFQQLLNEYCSVFHVLRNKFLRHKFLKHRVKWKKILLMVGKSALQRKLQLFFSERFWSQIAQSVIEAKHHLVQLSNLLTMNLFVDWLYLLLVTTCPVRGKYQLASTLKNMVFSIMKFSALVSRASHLPLFKVNIQIWFFQRFYLIFETANLQFEALLF